MAEYRWQDDAACRGYDDPSIFLYAVQCFEPDAAERVARAKAICAVCPVRAPCLAQASSPTVGGIWGGTTETERQRAKRNRGNARRVEHRKEQKAAA